MDEKELLNTLLNVSERKDARTDHYIQSMQRFLRQSKDWGPQHEQLFAQMSEEIRNDRRYKNLAMIAALVLILAFAGLAWYSYYNRSRNEEALRAFQEANLPIKLVDDGRGQSLTVQLDSSLEGVDEGQRERLQGLLKRFSRLGQYPHLGPHKNLPAVPSGDEDFTWLVRPDTPDPGAPVLGRIRLHGETGEIRPDFLGDEAAGTRFGLTLGEPVEYLSDNTGMSFFVRVVRYETRRRHWVLQFCEAQPRAASCEADAWSREYFVPKSPWGQQPVAFMLASPKWRSTYAVAVGAGEPGVPADAKEVRYAWYFRSIAARIGLGA